MAWLDRMVNFGGRVGEGEGRGVVYILRNGTTINVLLHGSLYIPHRSGLESRVLYIYRRDRARYTHACDIPNMCSVDRNSQQAC